MTYLYLPYTAAPSTSDKNFINYNKGGYAHCISITSKGYTLANCVAFVHGMWLKTITDAVGLDKAKEIESRMCRGNAEVYWNYYDEFERGQTPKLNAIMVWEGKGSRKGHVMTVTTIKDNGDVIATGSDYGGSKFYKKTYYKSKGYNFSGNFTFLGFVYCPYEFAYTVGSPVARNTEVNQVKITISNLRARSSASTSGTVMGYVNPGVYNVISIETAGGYTWYQIESGMWCAQVSGVTYLAGQPTPKYDVLAHNVTEAVADKIAAYAKNEMITRADIGNAEIPQAPIIGFTFFLVNRFIIFAKSTPPTVSKMNATKQQIIWTT